MRVRLFTLLAVAVALLGAQVAHAGLVVNVDWGPDEETSVAPVSYFASNFGGGTYVNAANQDQWDPVDTGWWFADSYGNAKAILLNNSNTYSGGGNSNTSDPLFRDVRLRNTEDPITFTISNLKANQAYKLVFYGADTITNEEYSLFTIAGVTKTTSDSMYQYTPIGDDSPVSKPYCHFDNVVSNDQGVISVTWADPTIGNGLRAPMNGFQLAEVPEPATLGLLAIGSLALIRVRARRKA
ncbi:MAG: hypothetical protein BIFFINMI_04400 [Phycisphaerae bacterium]|nr:hypothetical protein [Phycisphaerae bacterium]